MTRVLVLVAAAVLVPGHLVADDPKPAKDTSKDAVTVLYREHTVTLTGEHAREVRTLAVEMLRSACKERPEPQNNRTIAERYKAALNRSHVLITFAKTVEVPHAGNNKVPVQVEWLMIPFSPDLDPETIYVGPGKPFRVFADFEPDYCNDIREVLVKAGVYFPKLKIDAVLKDPLPPSH